MNRRAQAKDAVLRALAERTLDGAEWSYGLDLMRHARLRAGRFYVAIGDLEHDGGVKAKWATVESAGRPRRRMYALTNAEG